MTTPPSPPLPPLPPLPPSGPLPARAAGPLGSGMPIVLHHGFMDVINFRVGPVAFRSFQGLDRALEERGHRVMVSRVHPTASVAYRAAQLKQQVLERMRGEAGKVLLIAHSMGGLDARYMISKLGMGERVAALLTVSTPHRGSPYADFAMRNLTRARVMQLLRVVGLEKGAIRDLTGDACARFNEEVVDHPGVAYYSVSAACPWKMVPPWGLHPWHVIQKVEGANDGLVSPGSAAYGEHLGTWPVDHWRLLNKAIMPQGAGEGFDVTRGYLEAVERMSGGVG